MINPIGFSLANFPSSWYLSIEDFTVFEQISQERKKKQHKFYSQSKSVNYHQLTNKTGWLYTNNYKLPKIRTY